MADDIEATRAWVKNWQRTGELLDQMKAEELRAMTAEERVRTIENLSMHPRDAWMDPDRLESSGLVEQQRLFHRK